MQHMQGSDGVIYEQSAKTGAVARKIRTFEAGLTSPTTRGARRFPLSISRTAAALPFWSALTCAEAPSSADCTGRSGAAPPAYSVRRQGLRHHQPHLALIASQNRRAAPLIQGPPITRDNYATDTPTTYVLVGRLLPIVVEKTVKLSGLWREFQCIFSTQSEIGLFPVGERSL